jgi:hypothetical protein
VVQKGRQAIHRYAIPEHPFIPESHTRICQYPIDYIHLSFYIFWRHVLVSLLRRLAALLNSHSEHWLYVITQDVIAHFGRLLAIRLYLVARKYRNEINLNKIKIKYEKSIKNCAWQNPNKNNFTVLRFKTYFSVDLNIQITTFLTCTLLRIVSSHAQSSNALKL